MIHHYQKTLYHSIKRSKFFYFFLFLSAISSAVFALLLLARLFASAFIFASKCIVVDLLNSGAVIKPVISGIFSISADFILSAVLVARLVMSSIFFSISVVYLLKAAIVIKVVPLAILLSFCVICFL